MKEDGGYAEPSMEPTDIGGGFAHAIDSFNMPLAAQYDPRYRGMTMRQWYAGLAMQAVVSYHGECDEAYYANFAFKMADAMIAEEKK